MIAPRPGQTVFSKAFGMGTVCRCYEDKAICEFFEGGYRTVLTESLSFTPPQPGRLEGSEANKPKRGRPRKAVDEDAKQPGRLTAPDLKFLADCGIRW